MTSAGIKVVSVETKKRDPHALQSRFLKQHMGKPVTAKLADGSEVAGTLQEYDQYTMVLDQRAEDVLVYKHGILALRARRPG